MLKYWLKLSHIQGLGNVRCQKLIHAFGCPKNVFTATEQAIAHIIGPTLASRLIREQQCNTSEKYVDSIIEWAQRDHNQTVITWSDPQYPDALRHIYQAPSILFARGDLSRLDGPNLAIIGTRHPTPQGHKNAHQFAEALSAAGMTITSGLALGIDTAAHRGSLLQTAGTIAVLGSGLDCIYPTTNHALAHDISNNGLLLSEYPPKAPPRAHQFPYRNRIISGLSLGCLVIEAGLHSGSLITTQYAIEQGKEVFALPGSIHAPLARGCHTLIKQGAKLVDSIDDVLSELYEHMQHALQQHPATNQKHIHAKSIDQQPTKNTLPTFISSTDTNTHNHQHTQNIHAVLHAISDDIVTIDVLAQRSILTTATLSAILSELELSGLVAFLPGGRIQRQRAIL